MAFDAMAAAVDWLDAYRSGDIETLLGMYAENAVTECGCDAVTIVGKNGLKAYWERRLQNYPASELDDLEPLEDGAAVHYVTAGGHVAATLKFDSVGKILVLKCGPAKNKTPRRLARGTGERADPDGSPYLAEFVDPISFPDV